MTTDVSDLEASQNVLTRSNAEKAKVLALFFSSVCTHDNTDETLPI